MLSKEENDQVAGDMLGFDGAEDLSNAILHSNEAGAMAEQDKELDERPLDQPQDISFDELPDDQVEQQMLWEERSQSSQSFVALDLENLDAEIKQKSSSKPDEAIFVARVAFKPPMKQGYPRVVFPFCGKLKIFSSHLQFEPFRVDHKSVAVTDLFKIPIDQICNIEMQKKNLTRNMLVEVKWLPERNAAGKNQLGQQVGLEEAKEEEQVQNNKNNLLTFLKKKTDQFGQNKKNVYLIQKYKNFEDLDTVKDIILNRVQALKQEKLNNTTAGADQKQPCQQEQNSAANLQPAQEDSWLKIEQPMGPSYHESSLMDNYKQKKEQAISDAKNADKEYQTLQKRILGFVQGELQNNKEQLSNLSEEQMQSIELAMKMEIQIAIQKAVQRE